MAVTPLVHNEPYPTNASPESSEEPTMHDTPAPASLSPAPLTPAPLTPAPLTPAPLTPAPLTPAEEAYVMAVFHEVARIATRSRRSFDADDIAGEVALTVTYRPADIMNGYPDPVSYARQRVRHAGISFDRRERVQRGEGVRLYATQDGRRQPGRRYVSANTSGPDGSSDLLARVPDLSEPFEASVTDRMVTAALLQQCCEGLPPAEIREVWLVDGCGYTVQDVADFCGQRRETVSRRLNRSRNHIRRRSTDSGQPAGRVRT